MRLLPIALVSLIVLIAHTSSAQDAAARKVLDRFEQLQPREDDLAMYRLDWESSMSAAEQRAKQEQRPICLVIIHARYGDITSGHC